MCWPEHHHEPPGLGLHLIYSCRLAPTASPLWHVQAAVAVQGERKLRPQPPVDRGHLLPAQLISGPHGSAAAGDMPMDQQKFEDHCQAVVQPPCRGALA